MEQSNSPDIFGILSNIAGCLGFLLSLYLAFRSWIEKRINFKISVLDYNDYSESVRFLLAIENHSKSPLVISSISAFETVCELEPKRIRGNPTAWNGAISARLPIRVPARDTEIFYIELLTQRPIPLSAGTPVTFQIQAIGHTEQKTVLLGNRSHYLNKKA